MKQQITNKVVFIGKSLLWSLLLYAAVMLVANWDDINNKITGKGTIAVVRDTTPYDMPGANDPASISRHSGVMKRIFIIIRTISGLADVAVSQ